MSDIVERLKDWLQVTQGADSPKLKALFADAIAEIEFLRKHAGAVSRGPSLAEIAVNLPKKTIVEGGS